MGRGRVGREHAHKGAHRRTGREDEQMEKGQAWSMDLIFGVLVFLLAIGVIWALLMNKDSENIAPLRIESEVIANKLASDPKLAVAENNQLDPVKLGNLTSISYEELKRQFGTEKEFCIYLQDEAGNLIYIENASGSRFAGIGSGSGELNLSGTECGAALP